MNCDSAPGLTLRAILGGGPGARKYVEVVVGGALVTGTFSVGVGLVWMVGNMPSKIRLIWSRPDTRSELGATKAERWPLLGPFELIGSIKGQEVSKQKKIIVQAGLRLITC